MKLTLISIYYNGVKVSAFVNLPVSQDGKIRINDKLAADLFYHYARTIIRVGDTYSIGV